MTCDRCGAPARIEWTHPVHKLDAHYCEHCSRQVGPERVSAGWVARTTLPALTRDPATH